MPPAHLALLLLVACSSPRVLQPLAGRAAPPTVLHVDGAAAPGGDGSVHRPLRRLEEALGRAGAGTVRLAPGRYGGPFRVPAGATLEGPPGAVLTAGSGAPLLAAEGALTLRGLTLEGGEVAVAGPGPLVLEEVGLTGQHAGCLSLAGGRLRVQGGRMETGRALPRCLVLSGGADAVLAGVTLRGPFARAVELSGGATLEAVGVRVEEAVTAFHQRGGSARLREVEVAGAGGPGLFAAGGSLVLEGVRVRGHSYGLQTGRGTRLTARRLETLGATDAGVALVHTHGLLEGVRVRGSGPSGGVQLLGGEVTLRELLVEEARALGVSIMQGRVTLEGGEVRGVRGRAEEGDGEGVTVRRAEATLRGLTVRDVAGVGLLAAEGARVAADGVTVERAGVAGVAVETRGRLEAGRLEVRGGQGPALLAADTAHVRVETLVSEANAQGAVWAACAEGARVVVGEVQGDGRGGLEAPCVQHGGAVDGGGRQAVPPQGAAGPCRRSGAPGRATGPCR